MGCWPGCGRSWHGRPCSSVLSCERTCCSACLSGWTHSKRCPARCGREREAGRSGELRDMESGMGKMEIEERERERERERSNHVPANNVIRSRLSFFPYFISFFSLFFSFSFLFLYFARISLKFFSSPLLSLIYIYIYISHSPVPTVTPTP